MNGLVRAIFFGEQGELREKTMQRASVLNVLINAISIWNTIYLEKAAEYLKDLGKLDEKLLS